MKKHLIRNAILMAVATLIMGVFLSLSISSRYRRTPPA